MSVRIAVGDHSNDGIFICLEGGIVLKVLEVYENLDVYPIGLVRDDMYCELLKGKLFSNVNFVSDGDYIVCDQAKFAFQNSTFKKVLRAIKALTGVDSQTSVLSHIPKEILKHHYLTGEIYVDFDKRILLEYTHDFKHRIHIGGNVYNFTNKEIDEYVNQ